ncbi:MULTISPECIES: ABC transporter ATP-binding protein [Halomonas]|uniref:ABC transporter ATP-binding protein n=1 Tax=Halomonas TaxID=2745 RepID=UPI001C969975|nr:MULTISPECIES: ABC transporter ATP-binding protein [Halomonas]MBY6206133.1 ABC transporter ATP-binding protein [Halomonas sp. DP3Y7-2]MBY6227976.1 ABC transporter ATP-binding protein [Halomonas sp. DP3Y7-1]MCA0916043.1 ABC transporter ATP-binding protein [Halomonas denitrificans]
MIEIEHLYKRYHHHLVRNWVLQDIHLTIPTGVSVGVLGANGAGKSTLLRLIAGMDTAERGCIRRHVRVSWPMGLAGGFQGSLTGRQNVKFVARIHGAGRDVSDVIRRVAEFAELGEAFDEPIRTYSSGMRSRLNFGLSLAFDFDVYLSDEATSVGDRAFRAKATQAFKERVGRSSLVMVSHSEGILRELCQAGIYLKEGQAFWFDDINDAIAVYHRDSDQVLGARATTSLTETAVFPQMAPDQSESSTFIAGPETSLPDAEQQPPACQPADDKGVSLRSPKPTAGLDQIPLDTLRRMLRKRRHTMVRCQARLDALLDSATTGDVQPDGKLHESLVLRRNIARDRLHEIRRAIQARDPAHQGHGTSP